MNTLCFCTLLVSLGSLWLSAVPSEAYITRSTGCHHNGTWYADKSLVPTIEKCLNCKCSKKTLVCRLKVCPEMPLPPPRGCVVVQKKNTCCPFLSCARLEAFYKIPITRRIIAYLDHYERESIDRVVNENMLQRRSDDTEVDTFVCVKNGTVYKSGSAMSSSNLCTYCYCIGGSEKCVKPKCMLPVEGCKPIFVDSTCCPVRYDCSAKTSGKSSQEVRYRKTSNKHFLRMSQRLQRNRGCTVNKQFYAEGQKMKSDPDKPCDICFCIRGSRRCAPKKCSPALKNCIPVVPKGQCCPSSYDCGAQQDYRRSHNSRQFNLFSLLFGKDEDKPSGTPVIGEHYPHDRDPALAAAATKYKTHEQALEASSEQSIIDTLQEGLEFIDGNTNEMIKVNEDLFSLQAKRETVHLNATTTVKPILNNPSTTTEVSFLDLLLGGNDDFTNTQIQPQEIEAPPTTSTPAQDELSWVDILIGANDSNDDETHSVHIKNNSESTTNALSPELITSIDRLDEVVSNIGNSGEIVVSSGEEILNSIENTTSNLKKTNASGNETYIPIIPIKPATTRKPFPNTTQESTKPQKQAIKPIPLHSVEGQAQLKTEPTTEPAENTDLLSALLDGISNILSSEQRDNGTTLPVVAADTITESVKTKPMASMPSFKPIPTQKQHTRINSKIASLTTSPEALVKKPSKLTTSIHNSESELNKPTTTTFKTPTTTTSTKSVTKSTTPKSQPKTTVTTLRPLIINTNPTILEAEPSNDMQPTLPPSLPNLKIIPFLPTDAVEAADNKIYNYYPGHSPQVPSSNFEHFEDEKMYPAITEHSYTAYAVDLSDENKAQYTYKFNIEGPKENPVIAAAAKKNSADPFSKYEFVAKNRFSPPAKTEGGFMPKEVLPLDERNSEVVVGSEFNVSKSNELYPATMHVIDLTTALPIVGNLTQIIDITTPDPFKDVIHTEPPPDLTAIKQQTPDNQVTTIELNASYPTQSISGNTTKATNSTNVELSTKPPNSLVISSSSETNKNSIETLLDILFKDNEEDEINVTFKTNSITSTIPPFKTLPHKTLERLSSTQSTSTKKLATTTTAATTTTTAASSTVIVTKRPQHRTKSTPTTNNKTKTKPNNATRRPQTQTQTQTTHAQPTKPTKLKNNTVNRKAASTMTSATLLPTSTSVTRTPTQTSIPTLSPSLTQKTSTTVKKSEKIGLGSLSSAASVSETASRSKLKLPTAQPISSEQANKFAFKSTTTHNPFLMSPFDKLPFMDASFEVKRRTTKTPVPAPQSDSHLLSRLDGLVAAYDISNAISYSGSAITTTTTTTTPHPPHVSGTEKHSMSTSNSLIDPTGILKLAGCNIYGRMYRVGRIILELSSPCVECKCTEIGVKCIQLDC